MNGCAITAALIELVAKLVPGIFFPWVFKKHYLIQEFIVIEKILIPKIYHAFLTLSVKSPMIHVRSTTAGRPPKVDAPTFLTAFQKKRSLHLRRRDRL
jgi:hypothetical protein